ncbi:MAG: RluA family pseudouridine synthase [Alphaproteobacteria bacterium]|nr:RluA family pseudouridine synthase [Alphaproteobacteria bacterium]
MVEPDIITADVGAAEGKMRLDKFLSLKIPEMSRAQIQRLISEGNVSSEDIVMADNAFKVHAGDSFQIIIPPAAEAEPEPENITLDVVYEDDDLIVVNKPAGMTVHPAPGAYNGTLVNALLYHCRDNLSGIGGVKRPGIVHRIDKETSGLLVVAKNDLAHQGLSVQFAEHSIERTYLAVVYGVIIPPIGRITGNIGRSKFDRKKMAILESGGKPAATNYKTIETFGRAASLVQCNLETGRTHQIRVHLSSMGHALIGDKVYVKNKKSEIAVPADLKKYVNEFPRQALHAKSLGFEHPRTHQFMQFDSELPVDMQELAARLRDNFDFK